MLLGQGKGRCRRPQVTVAMADPSIPRDLSEALGGFVTMRSSVPAWNVYGSLALDILERVHPHLVIERRRSLGSLLLEHAPELRAAGGNKIMLTNRLFRQMKSINRRRTPRPPAVWERTWLEDHHMQYAAAVLDASGSISFERKKIEVWSTDPELCAWLASYFGGKVYNGRMARGQRRATWRWVRPASGCDWAARVAKRMRNRGKAAELAQFQGYRYVPPRPSTKPHPADQQYLELRRKSTSRAESMRQTGMPRERAKLLDTANGWYEA